ncbi:unnamed protein product [Dovyalis caffra]|uniref:Uncharacterized protein n=1 Tax=Dovyalis caffra TaxID=77055 RepID=A0AAV1SCS4_9ROSI|nr:unnamed protein product [Dovyalis caffra]
MALLFNSPEISTVKILFNPNPRNLKSLNVRVRARNDVKDCEARVSGLNQNGRLYGQFSAPVKQETKITKEEEEKQNYYVNMGYAIRTLREEFRELFYRELSFDIYSCCDWKGKWDQNDQIAGVSVVSYYGKRLDRTRLLGLVKYRAHMFCNLVKFRDASAQAEGDMGWALWVDVVSVSQPAENVIMIRWTVHGIPRVPWESCARFDGLSEYKLDSKGKIFQHRVDNIALNSPPKFHVLTVEELIQSIGCHSTPKPTFLKFHLP